MSPPESPAPPREPPDTPSDTQPHARSEREPATPLEGEPAPKNAGELEGGAEPAPGAHGAHVQGEPVEPAEPEAPHEREAPPARSRRWLRPLLVLAAVGTFLIVTGKVGPLARTPCEIVVRLDAPRDIEHVRLGYAPEGGDELRSVVFRFVPGQAPATVRHDVELPKGTYRVSIELGRAGRTELVERTIELGEASSVTIEARGR